MSSVDLYSVPDQVNALKFSHVTDSSFMVEWLPPTYVNGDLTGRLPFQDPLMLVMGYFLPKSHATLFYALCIVIHIHFLYFVIILQLTQKHTK